MSNHLDQIESKLKRQFCPEYLEVVNESHMHSVPENSQTHFKVTIVSDAFAGLNAVKRHQQVYGTLQQELAGGVHALAMHLYTPEQWQRRGESAPASPQCAGGSKSNS